MCWLTEEPPFRVVTACDALGPLLAGRRFHFLVRDAPMAAGHLDALDQFVRTELRVAGLRAASRGLVGLDP